MNYGAGSDLQFSGGLLPLNCSSTTNLKMVGAYNAWNGSPQSKYVFTLLSFTLWYGAHVLIELESHSGNFLPCLITEQQTTVQSPCLRSFSVIEWSQPAEGLKGVEMCVGEKRQIVFLQLDDVFTTISKTISSGKLCLPFDDGHSVQCVNQSSLTDNSHLLRQKTGWMICVL